jgi:hypothetical protein
MMKSRISVSAIAAEILDWGNYGDQGDFHWGSLTGLPLSG